MIFVISVIFVILSHLSQESQKSHYHIGLKTSCQYLLTALTEEALHIVGESDPTLATMTFNAEIASVAADDVKDTFKVAAAAVNKFSQSVPSKVRQKVVQDDSS